MPQLRNEHADPRGRVQALPVVRVVSMRIITVWEQERKPCPFCGGEAELRDTSFGEYYVKCRKCGINTPAFTRPDTVIKRWNRRVNS